MAKVDNTKEILEFMKEGETYIMLGIVRTKDNDVEKCKRHKFKYIIDSKNRLLKKIKEIEELVKLDPSVEYRIYLSYNSRNVKNALKNFQKLLLDYSHTIQDASTLDAVSRLDLKWFSELAKNTSSNKEYMMIDLDENTVKAIKDFRKTFNVVLCVPTKNGYHIVFKRDEMLNEYFKSNIWLDYDYEIKKDDLILVKII